MSVEELTTALSENRASAYSWRQGLLNGFVEREVEAGLMLLALVAEEHLLLIGDPGTAKSALANALCSMLGGKQFSILFTRFTTPEEVFGPLSLRALEQDRYQRATAGYLPDATIAFLDEAFKANSAILNTLLPILNERVYFEAGVAQRVPLELVVGASNELPDEDAPLTALYDRFLFRRMVSPIRDRDKFVQFLDAELPDSRPKIAMADLVRLRAAAKRVRMSHEAKIAIVGMKDYLLSKKIVVSDRRWKKCLKVLRASAACEGRDAVIPGDFHVLPDCLWQTPEQRVEIDKRVRTIAWSTGAASGATPPSPPRPTAPTAPATSVLPRPTPPGTPVRGESSWFTQMKPPSTMYDPTTEAIARNPGPGRDSYASGIAQRIALVQSHVNLNPEERTELVKRYLERARAFGIGDADVLPPTP